MKMEKFVPYVGREKFQISRKGKKRRLQWGGSSFPQRNHQRQKGVCRLWASSLWFTYLPNTSLSRQTCLVALVVLLVNWVGHKWLFEGLLEIVTALEIFKSVVFGSAKNSVFNQIKNDISKISAFSYILMIHESKGHRTKTIQGIVPNSLQQFNP